MTPPLESTQEALEPDPLESREAGAKVIRGGGLRAAAHVIGVLVGVVSAPLVVRHLGVEDYGRFVLVTSIIFIVTGLTEGGLANVAIRQYATGDRSERRALIAALAGLRVVLSVVGSIGAIAFGLIAGYPGVVLAGIGLGCVALLFNNLWGTLNTALVADLKLTATATIEIVRSLATTLLFLVLVLAGAGLLGFYVVAPAVAVLTWLVAATVVRGTVPLVPRRDPARWRALGRETALYAAATALGAIYFQVALVSTSLLTDDHETGLYGIAFRIVDLANGVPWLLAGSVFPIFAHAALNDTTRLRYAVGRVTEVGLIVGLWFALTIVLGAKFGIDVVAGAEGEGSVPVLRILSIGVGATFLVAAWGFVLLSQQRYRDLLVANVFAFVLAVVLSVILIPEFGAKGSAAVTATLELTLATTYGVLLGRGAEPTRPGATIVPKLLLALAAAFAVGLPLLLVHPVPATIAGGLVYFAVLWVTGAIPPELLEAVRRRRAS